eukprot:scaffold70338_cov66-Phaeocystis_antarctica.AAC.1
MLMTSPRLACSTVTPHRRSTTCGHVLLHEELALAGHVAEGARQEDAQRLPTDVRVASVHRHSADALPADCGEPPHHARLLGADEWRHLAQPPHAARHAAGQWRWWGGRAACRLRHLLLLYIQPAR